MSKSLEGRFAKVVFHSQIEKKIDQDPRVLNMIQEKERARTKNLSDKKWNELEISLKTLKNQLITELEDKESIEFDNIHNVERAFKVGSIDGIIPIHELRDSIIQYFEHYLMV